MAFGNGPSVVTNGLVLALDAADRNSYVSGSTTWNDLSGNGYNFIGTGSYGFSNNAIVFNRNNATNTGTIFTLSNIANQLKIENILSGSFTIETWILPQTLSGSNFDATETDQGIVVWPGFHNTQRISLNGSSTIFASVWNSARTSEFTVTSTSSLNLNNFNHVVGVVNREVTQSLGYVNGTLNVLSGSIPPSAMTSANGVPANTLNIGAARNISQYRWFYTGSIAIVKVYNRALSAAEIAQNYNAQKSRFNL
jgi:hypothetical protein